MKNISYLIIGAMLFIILDAFVFSDEAFNKKLVSEDYLLTITEHAFLEGYSAGLTKKDIDSTWSDLSSKFRFKK